MRVFPLLLTSTLLTVTGDVLLKSEVDAADSKPRWVLHVERFSGGISNGVRFSLDPGVVEAQRRNAAALTEPRSIGSNVQMNSDSYPGVPQNEESVAYSLEDPLVAVAAANDYVSGGVVVMRTNDGGQHWRSLRVVPQYVPTRDFCSGGDPAVAYSLRDHAFYLSQLCFFRAASPSEVHVFKSVDGGKTWTPGRFAAVAATNYSPTFGLDDPSFFNDKEYIGVDNYPGSPHYGRIYVSYTRFHMLPDGFSDSCPIQLSHTDEIPSENPSLTSWKHVCRA